MTLDEAIKHAIYESLNIKDCYCADEHRQLAEWLTQLKRFQDTDKAKDERIAELEARIQNMCAECECAKFADNAIKPSEMWKLHLALKDNK